MTAIASLNEIAASRDTRVREANLMYGDPIERFEWRCRLELDGTPIILYAGDTLLYADVSRRSPFAMAFGRPALHLIGASLPVDVVAGTPIFGSQSSYDRAEQLKGDPCIARYLETIALRIDEQIVVAENKAIVVLRSEGAEIDLRRLQAILTLLTVVAAEDGERPTPSDAPQLPPALGIRASDLMSLSQWALSDDDVRASMLANATEAELQELAALLRQHGDALNEMLDAISTTDPEGAATWGALYEAAVEAQAELARRHPGGNAGI